MHSDFPYSKGKALFAFTVGFLEKPVNKGLKVYLNIAYLLTTNSNREQSQRKILRIVLSVKGSISDRS